MSEQTTDSLALPTEARPQSATQPVQARRRMSDLPKDELEHLANLYGVDPTRSPSRQHLIAAMHERFDLIENLDRDALLDVVRWARRPVPSNATVEQLALETVKVRSWRFDGLSGRGLSVLARLRGVRLEGSESRGKIIRKLRRREGLISRLNRKRRGAIASLVSKVVGDEEEEYRFLPPSEDNEQTVEESAASHSRRSSIKEDIQESGLFGGIANRVKRSTDDYLNQKLDEIESRIDRKLDEIDARLAEWRDKEIANRVKILKITLWVSAIVALVSLFYLYIKTYFISPPGG